jgi:hypothetical protein
MRSAADLVAWSCLYSLALGKSNKGALPAGLVASPPRGLAPWMGMDKTAAPAHPEGATNEAFNTGSHGVLEQDAGLPGVTAPEYWQRAP